MMQSRRKYNQTNKYIEDMIMHKASHFVTMIKMERQSRQGRKIKKENIMQLEKKAKQMNEYIDDMILQAERDMNTKK